MSFRAKKDQRAIHTLMYVRSQDILTYVDIRPDSRDPQ